MSEFKTDLLVGVKLNLGLNADQFEDWHDRLEGLLRANYKGAGQSAYSGTQQ
jgi:hypothetical protein